VSAQTYPRLGVVAVDQGSTDGSWDMLVQSLGEARVLRSEPGPGAALARVVKLEAAQAVDYFLLLHDDAIMAPDAVQQLVESAEAIEGAGIAGAKLVDADNPRVLKDVGWSIDRFGHAYSPLEANELDQGQYDRIREVLFVSGAAMLVSYEVVIKTGTPDERLGPYHPDLDYCWRARLAGFSVILSPLAVVRHHDAGAAGERRGDRRAEHPRYYEERAAGDAVLKNYGLASLWLLPVYLVQGLVKFLVLVLGRRFEEAGGLVASWGWHVVRLPGTLVRRRRAQASRKVKDSEIHRYMAHGSVRFRKWMDAAGRVVPGDIDIPDEDDAAASFVPLHERAGTAAKGHPVAAAWLLSALVAAFAMRHLVGRGQLTGGVLPASLPSGGEFFTELVSAVRTTVLGGQQSASPALAIPGAIGSLPLSSTQFAEKILLGALPFLAGVSMYRMAFRACQAKVPALLGAGIYVLAPISLWSFSTGRIPALVLLAVLPRLAERLMMAFAPVAPGRRWRFVVGTGAFLAVSFCFFPGTALAAGILLLVSLLTPERPARWGGGMALSLGVVVAAAVLSFPLLIQLYQQAGVGLGSLTGYPSVEGMLRTVVMPGKGDWVIGWILPASAAMGILLAGPHRRLLTVRFAMSAAAGVGLGWASAAGWLPEQVSNPTAYIAVAALSYGALIALGLTSVAERRRGVSLGRALGVLTSAGVVALLVANALLASWGTWDVGRRRLPPAWPLITAEQGDFRILWIGADPGVPLPAPAGEISRVFENGDDSFAYTLTGRTGVSALDVGRTLEGDGYGYLDDALVELMSGRTRHAGAILGPLGVRYVVAEDGQIPHGVVSQLEEQIDMSLVPAGGLTIYRNSANVMPGSVLPAEGFAALDSNDLSGASRLPRDSDTESIEPVEGGWDGADTDGLVWPGTQFAPGWQMTAGTLEQAPEEALEWALAFTPPEGTGAFEIRYRDQQIWTYLMIALGLLWLAALWTTRKPARR